MRRFAISALLLAALAVPAATHALVTLVSAGGLDYDVYENTYGYISDGAANAYDNAYWLQVNGSYYYASSMAATTTMGGRQIEMAEMTVSTVRVKRIFYVPSSGGEYGRYLDLIRNPGSSDVTVTVRIFGDLGSNTLTRVTASSSGDLLVQPTDTWFATDDTTDGGGSQSVAHVMAGPGALVTPSVATLTSDDFSWQFSVTVPAGGQVAFLTFAIQGANDAAAQAEARRVLALPGDALAGIDAYIPDIVNFAVGGAPIVQLMGPSELDEGEALMLDVTVTDREGDPTTWSWDTNGDGTFGDMPGATSYMIAAGTTDGDATLRIGVRASDGTESRESYRSVTIRNVAPTVSSTPPTEPIYVNSPYRYDVVVSDPAGTRDFPAFALTEAPDGMTVSRGGTVSWTPSQPQRDLDFHVALSVDDGDGGTVVHEWDAHVESNRGPEPPVPAWPIDRESIAETMPTLRTMNAVDADGDGLSYYFKIDRASGFNSMFLIESPEIAGSMSGETSWTVPTFLQPGIYYWQVRASDGLADSAPAMAVFVVRDPDAEPDAGPGRPDSGPGADAGTIAPPPRRSDSGGCAVSPIEEAAPAGGLAWLGVASLLAWRRRRR